MNRQALARLGDESVLPGCSPIPPGISGHPTDSCPYGDADDAGDLPAGRQLVKASGTYGAHVTVSVENSPPQRAYARYYTKLLNRLGFVPRRRVTTPMARIRQSRKVEGGPTDGLCQLVQRLPESERLL